MKFMPLFDGKHPRVMAERIRTMGWGKYLRYEGAPINMKKKFGFKYRIINYIENKFLSEGNRIGGFKNYELVK